MSKRIAGRFSQIAMAFPQRTIIGCAEPQREKIGLALVEALPLGRRSDDVFGRLSVLLEGRLGVRAESIGASLGCLVEQRPGLIAVAPAPEADHRGDPGDRFA